MFVYNPTVMYSIAAARVSRCSSVVGNGIKAETDRRILMTISERRQPAGSDRRSMPRGGRREGDQPGHYPNVLIADSYDGARGPCARYLARFAFRVEECTDGEEALAAISVRPPHLILVEDGLPRIPASRMVRLLKEQ